MTSFGTPLRWSLAAFLICLIGLVPRVHADPSTLHSPELQLPDDTTFAVCLGEEICYEVGATDADSNETFTLTLLAGPVSFGPEVFVGDFTTEFCFTPSQSGEYTFVWQVVDSLGATDIDTVVVTAELNSPPAIDDQTFGPEVLCDDDTRVLQLVAVDADGDPFEWTILSGPGSIDSTGRLIYNPVVGFTEWVVEVRNECGFDRAKIEDSVEFVPPPSVECPEPFSVVLCSPEPIEVGPFVARDFDQVSINLGTLTVVDSSDDSRTYTATFTPDTAGRYDIVFTVSNDCGDAACVHFVTVAYDEAPVVSLADDFSIQLCTPEAICFDAFVDDPEFGPTMVSTNLGEYDDASDRICFTPDTAGLYTIIATATDSCGKSASDTILVTVELNEPPTIAFGEPNPFDLCIDQQICIPLIVSDDNVASLAANFGFIDPETQELCFTPDTNGSYTLIAYVTDDCGATDSATFVLQVETPSPATIAGFNDTTVYICEPTEICLPTTITGGVISVSVNMGQYDAEAGTVCFMPYDSGQFELILTVEDSCGTTIDTAFVTVTTDQQIQLVCPSDTSVFLCEADTLCFPIDGVPAGATVRPIGTGTFWDEEKQAICFFSDCCIENEIGIEVITDCGVVSCTFTVEVVTNSRPLVILPNDTTLFACDTASLCIPVGISDIDNNIASIRVSGGSYSAETSTICIETEQAGQVIVMVTVTDSCGAVRSDMTIIDVEINTPPIVTIDSEADTIIACVGDTVCLPVTIEDVEGDVVLIEGVNETIYNAEAGTICLVADLLDSAYTFEIVVEDSCGARTVATRTVWLDGKVPLAIECVDPELFELCGPDTIGFPISITGIPDSIFVEYFAFIRNDSVFFFADTTGVYGIGIELFDECGSARCGLSVAVVISEDPQLVCPSDTAVLLCADEEIRLPFSVSPFATVTFDAGGEFTRIDGDEIIITPNGSGTFIVRLRAETPCSVDTCSFKVIATENSAPVISLSDSMLTLCELTEICLPVDVFDVDGNLDGVTYEIRDLNGEEQNFGRLVSNRGKDQGGIDPAATVVGDSICFLPESFGLFEVIAIATDSCGLADTAVAVVDIHQGEAITIMCPTPEPVGLCGREKICIDVPIAGIPQSVLTSFGSWEDGVLCFFADTAGLYSIEVIASAECGDDTCRIDIPVMIADSVGVTCLTGDTTIFACELPATYSFPVDITGDVVDIVVSPSNAVLVDGEIQLTVESAGSYDISIVVSNECNVDSCGFTVTVDENTPPMISSRDSMLVLCDLQTICVPVDVVDADGNLIDVTTSLGQFGDELVCFEPDTFGVYTIVVTATDECQTVVEDTIIVTVNEGTTVAIDCPTETFVTSRPLPDSVRVPITITPAGVDVQLLPEGIGRYDAETGEAVVWITEPGVTSYTLVASSECNTDTCAFSIEAGGYTPPVVACEGIVDTILCLLEPETVCLPVPVSGTDVTVTVSPIGSYDNGLLCIPVDTAGTYLITIIAANEFDADTCQTSLTVTRQNPPQVSLPADFLFNGCSTDTLCIFTEVIADNDSLLTVTVSGPIGTTYNRETGEICVPALEEGVITVSLTATDECGNEASDSTTITVNLNDPPVIDPGDDTTVVLCGPEEICLPVVVVDDDRFTVTGSIGVYDSEAGTLCFTPDTAGLYEVEIVASDSCFAEVYDTVLVGVTFLDGAEISGLRDTSVYLCTPTEVCIPFTVENATSVTTNLGMIKDGAVCFVPYDSGVFSVVITATDSCGTEVSDTALVTVETDQAIVLECPSDTTIFLCDPDTLCFFVGGVPDDAIVTVRGTGAYWDPATQSVCFFSDCCIDNTLRVTVTTPCGAQKSCEFTVTVMTNSKPVVILPQDETISQCEADSICIPVGIDDVDDNIVSVEVTGGVYNPATSSICFFPDTAGTYFVTVFATDECGLVDMDMATITVIPNRPPMITPTVFDTTVALCGPETICIPTLIEDPDLNIEIIDVVGGAFADGSLCLTIDSAGEFCAQVIAIDSCGAADTVEVCVTASFKELAAIDCPELSSEPIVYCDPADTQLTYCLAIPVTGDDVSVTTTFGTWSNDTLCFPIDSSGTYEITVIAASDCNADTCVISLPIEILPPVQITCPESIIDPGLFLCSVDTVCLPYTITSTVSEVTVSGGEAFLSDTGTVCVPILQSGSQEITLIASGDCGADTCSFTVVAQINRRPMITVQDTLAIVSCELTEQCIPISVTDLDGNLAEVSSDFGTIDGDTLLCFTPQSFGTIVIRVSAVDSCSASSIDSIVVVVDEGPTASILCPDELQFASLCDPDTVCVIAPVSPDVATVTVLPAGSYNAETGEVCFQADTSGTYDITVIADAVCGSDTCTFSVQVTINESPVISCPPSIDTLLCLATPDTLCFPVTVTGSGVDVTVSEGGFFEAGFVCIPVTEAGTIDVLIVAQGICGVDSCVTSVTVTADEAPMLSLPMVMPITRCPDDSGAVCITGIRASDLESDVTLSLVCATDYGSLSGDPADSVTLCFTPDTLGRYAFCLEASDGCNSTRDTLFVDVIERDDCDVCVRFSFDYGECVPVNQLHTVDLNVETNRPIGGFELLLSYDASAISFQTADNEGTAIGDWEYFVFNLGSGACGSACPSGLIRLVGIADINNGAPSPPQSAYSPNGTLAKLRFLIANNQNLGAQFIPISFVWYTCTDNAVSDPTGAELYLDSRIFSANDLVVWDEFDDVNFPESERPFGVGSPDDCLTGSEKNAPVRCIEFYNGGLCIIDPDSIDDRGDVNLNGIAYEIADAVLFTNYFLYGLSVFDVSVPGSVAATDVNGDGATLTVTDLTMLIRVIVGDADPNPKLNPYGQPADVWVQNDRGRPVVTSSTVAEIGAGHFVFDLPEGSRVDQVVPLSSLTEVDLIYDVVDNQLRVLVYDIGTGRVASGQNELFEIIGDGPAPVLVTAALADYFGRPYELNAASTGLPSEYVLAQNYPNPFNPTTTIGFSLPDAGEWRLSIYNITGALVREYTGSSGAGTIEVDWDGMTLTGRPAATGVYLYRLEAGSFSATKKMVLLK